MFIDVIQNTEEWFNLRIGKATSSNFAKIMANNNKAFGNPAIEYAQKGISVSKTDSNNQARPVLYGNMGICYSRLGMPDSALHYYLICREISKNKKQLYLDNEADIAKLYAGQKKYALSNQAFRHAVAKNLHCHECSVGTSLGMSFGRSWYDF